MSTLSLFDELSLSDSSSPSIGITIDDLHKLSHPLIGGLVYIDNFLTVDQESNILDRIDKSVWLCEFERRVQHYGYKYDYRAKRIDDSMRVGEMPRWMRYFGHKLYQCGYFDRNPDQVIVNEYLPGQGIAMHVDCEPCFGPVIASVSLGSGCYMDFIHTKTGEAESVWLAPRSVVVLSGDSRHLWRHGIAKRKGDLRNGENTRRNRRVSLTYRTVMLTH